MAAAVTPSSSSSVCNACRRKPNDPRIIPCGHSFCLNCIQSASSCSSNRAGIQVDCPTCGVKQNVHVRSLADLPKNMFPETIRLGNPVDYCAEHIDEMADRYCRDCERVVCALCRRNSHTDHSYISVHQYGKKFIPWLRSDVCNGRSRCRAMTERVRPSDITRAKTAVEKRAGDLKAMIDEHAKVLVAQLDLADKDRAHKMKAVRQCVDERSKQLEEMDKYLLALLEHGREGDILDRAAMLQNEVKHLVDLISVERSVTGLTKSGVAAKQPPLDANGSSAWLSQMFGTIEISKIDDLLSMTPWHVIPQLSPGYPVCAVALFDRLLYVARERKDVAPNHIDVYDAASNYDRCDALVVPGLGSYPFGLAVCTVNRCLYVSDYDNGAVHRVSLADAGGGQGSARREVQSWPVGEFPIGVSVTWQQQRVLVTFHYANRIAEFTTGGRPVRTIDTEPGMAYITDAAQLPDGRLVVTQGMQNSPRHGVCLLGLDGKLVRRIGDKVGADVGKFSCPTRLLLVPGGGGGVLVSDSLNNRIVMVDLPSLDNPRVIRVDGGGGGGLQSPRAMFHDARDRQLYVGEGALGPDRVGCRVMVFDSTAVTLASVRLPPGGDATGNSDQKSQQL